MITVKQTFKVYKVVSAEEAEQIHQARIIVALITRLKLREIVKRMLS